MADEEKNEQVEETPDAPAEEAPAEDAPAEEAPAKDTPAEDAPAEEAPADDAPAEEAAPAADAGDEGEPEEEEPLGPKQIRKLKRATAVGPAKPQRSPEERAAERAERRKADSAERRRYRLRSRGKRTEPGTGTPPAERHPVARKERQGLVVSSKSDKTITVRIDVSRRHPVYEKVVRRSNTVHAHDESNEAGEGDVVRLIESRPLSKTKRWRLVEVVEKAK